MHYNFLLNETLKSKAALYKVNFDNIHNQADILYYNEK